MEYKHKEKLKTEYGKLLQHKKVIVFDIPDEYKYMDVELIELIKSSLEEYIWEEKRQKNYLRNS